MASPATAIQWTPSASDADGQVIVDLDGVLVIAHSDKQDAAATWKKTFGHHPLVAFIDHGRRAAPENQRRVLRPGNLAATPPPTTSTPPGWLTKDARLKGGRSLSNLMSGQCLLVDVELVLEGRVC